MSLDNEIIMKMLEIIKDDHAKMLEIIKDKLNKEDIHPKTEEKFEEQGDETNKLNKEEQDNLKKGLKHINKVHDDDIKSIHSNRWITHVKEFAKINNISYKEALSKASSTYNKK